LRALKPLLIVMGILMSHCALAAEGVPMVLATVGISSPRLNVVAGQLDKTHPGWFIELSNRAAKECGIDLTIIFRPWSTVLEMVKQGYIAGGFNSSFKTERALYAQYPLLNGQPDETKAAQNYSYYAYVAINSQDRSLLKDANVAGRNIAVEKGASIISKLEKEGAHVFEISSNKTMLQLVANNHYDGVIGIDYNLDSILRKNPDLAALIRKSEVPIEKKVGYVMFSKKYYADHKDTVECFWDQSAVIKNTKWFEDMRASYE
jgi:polar amino acid transport system substrate-binding protein